MIREVNNDNDDDVDDEALPPEKKMLLDETAVDHTVDIDSEIKRMNEKHQKKMTKLKKMLKTTQQKARRLKKKSNLPEIDCEAAEGERSNHFCL